MNYTEIKNTALGYSDRVKDVEVLANFDNFLRIVESQVNKQLDVREMAVRTRLSTTPGQEYVGLPPDFKALRDIEYTASNAPGVVTLEYLSPKQANDAKNQGYKSTQFYTIIADQIQLIPASDVGVIEIIYARNLPALTPTANFNWLSDDYPEVYIFGLCTEIAAFAKDAPALAIWEQRFQGALGMLRDDDAVSRWSGTSLRVRLG